MKKLLVIIVIISTTFLGCSTYKLSTINHDPIYAPDGTEIKFDVIDNEFQLARKFRTDAKFRWDFAQYAMNQDLRWNYDFYFNNRMYRRGFGSPFDFYWNSNQYWWNWAWNYPYGNGIGFSYSWNNNRWSSNNWYGWNYGWGGYYSYYGWSPWHHPHYRNNNIFYNSGRRTVNNTISNRVVRVIPQTRPNTSTTTIRTKPRVLYNTKPRVINNPPVIRNTRPNNRRVTNNNPPRIYTRPPVNNSNTSTRTPTRVSKRTNNTRGSSSNKKN